MKDLIQKKGKLIEFFDNFNLKNNRVIDFNAKCVFSIQVFKEKGWYGYKDQKKYKKKVKQICFSDIGIMSNIYSV